MVILASLIAQQALGEYKVMVGSALNVGVTPVEVKEILYQAVPYVGIAKVFDFLLATNEVLESRGIKLPLAGQSTTTPETRMEKGLALSKSIFSAAIDTMYEQSPKNQLHIQRYLSANCFGDYYTRTGLDIKTRELLTFSIILSLGGCEPQLKGHIQGNANVGNNKETLLSVVTQLLPYVGYPRTLNAIRCLNEVLPEDESRG
jgi:4-carboxymuconolactone decarboxylase